MNPIKAVGRRLNAHKGFTYVMDSTLWECDSCGERVTHRGKARHPKSCPERVSPSSASEKPMVAEKPTIAELRPNQGPAGRGRSDDAGGDCAVG